jgi:hypothetical protein
LVFVRRRRVFSYRNRLTVVLPRMEAAPALQADIALFFEEEVASAARAGVETKPGSGCCSHIDRLSQPPLVAKKD